MLTYAFDLLYAIYEEEGYASSEICEKILTHNLYGIELDERAGELAAFALTMKARSKQRRFFNKEVTPNICILQNVQFDEGELKGYMDEMGRDLFSSALPQTVLQFDEADNFGSLIVPQATDVAELRQMLEAKDMGGQLFLHGTHKKVLQALEMADYLSPKYHVVVANPPYMGGKGMNASLANFAKKNYPDSKSDLFAMFMERCVELSRASGYMGMINMQSWMFLSSYEKLRAKLLANQAIISMAHLGARGFDSIGGEVVSTTAFVLQNSALPDYKGQCLRLVDGMSEAEKSAQAQKAIQNQGCGWFYRVSSNDLKKIPGAPVVYWLSPKLISTFEDGNSLGDRIALKAGLSTGDNVTYQRQWYEVATNRTNHIATDAEDAEKSGCKWFPCHSGGEYKKWYGNHAVIVNWEKNGAAIRAFKGSAVRNDTFYFKVGITWSKVSTGIFAARYRPYGFLFDDTGRCGFADNLNQTKESLALLCSCLSDVYLKALCPTLSFTSGEIAKIPHLSADAAVINTIVDACILQTKADWDSYETSWDFTTLPLLQPVETFQTLENSGGKVPTIGKIDGEISNPWNQSLQTLEKTYAELSNHWKSMTLEMQRLEEENNRIFIDAYGLQDELTPEVPLNEITLTCNPHYRYKLSGQWLVASDQEKEEELEKRLCEDTMKEFISYAVGCMFGRYSLDKPGLILANQGETVADYVRKVCSDKCVVDRETVGSGKWEVGSADELPTIHSPLSTKENGVNDYGDSEELSRADCVAESDGLGRAGLSGNETISERGALRADESGETSGSFSTFKHRRGTSSEVDEGISKFLIHCERFESRGGDPNPACPALELCNQRFCTANSESGGRSVSSAERVDEQSQVTTHCPLSTIHFLPDDDNVIPILEGDWFTDDAAERFRKFLRVTFGEEYYEENLRFIEKAIGKDLQKYFLKDFYADHVKRYKKRPIYWLFSSPKGSFNALIYMHRYRPDTVSVVLNDYLREFRTKLNAKLEHLLQVDASADASKSDKTKALKEIEKIKKILDELDTYEHETLYPLAGQQIEIDLDDGVKVNYPKFGIALKKIAGLS